MALAACRALVYSHPAPRQPSEVGAASPAETQGIGAVERRLSRSHSARTLGSTPPHPGTADGESWLCPGLGGRCYVKCEVKGSRRTLLSVSLTLKHGRTFGIP